jgi:hypothetical protein
MKINKYLSRVLLEKLSHNRVIVWYDGERVFGDLVAGLDLPNVNIVSAHESVLTARRRAETFFRQIDNPSAPLRDKDAHLLIYVPYRRASDNEARTLDPFEGFAAAGAAFGEIESEQLKSLAIRALPEFSDQIERMFREGQPTLAVLDSLSKSPAYPLVNQALGTRAVVDVAALLLGDKDNLRKITGLSGCSSETLRLLKDELGFSPSTDVTKWDSLRVLLARYILFSEFMFDLNVSLPDALSNLPRAAAEYRERILNIAERLRDSSQWRESYLELATQVERDLDLPRHFEALSTPGARDTFAFEERIHLRNLAQSTASGDLPLARQIVSERRTSVWRHQIERSSLWAVAERSLTLLETAARLEPDWKKDAASVKSMTRAYSSENGWSDLDRAQRLMEQSIAECPLKEELENLIEQARAHYRNLADAIQQRFLERIEAEGWPPEDTLRQTQIYDRFIVPALAAREKTAYILADSLRFEMGRDLAQLLAEFGQVELQAAASALPTITEVGMAALLPGADGAFTFKLENEEVVPCIGGKLVKDLPARLAFLREKLGDRMVEMQVSDFLSLPSTQRQSAALKNADLVILRAPDIDKLGEKLSLKDARRFMTEMLGDLKVACGNLARLGYSRLVIVSDHGHMLLPEIRPGDVTTQAPAGEWGWNKRRFRLGHLVQEKRSARIFNAVHLGILGDLPDLVVPDGFGLYSDGSGYFHGGLSLQESLIPVIIVTAAQKTVDQAGVQDIQIKYRSNTYTSPVLGLKIWYNSMLTPQLSVKLEAFDGPGARANKVGEVAECDARDETSHLVTLMAGQETQVPLLLDADFRGQSVEIRVTNPDAPVVWARLILKNGIMD